MCRCRQAIVKGRLLAAVTGNKDGKEPEKRVIRLLSLVRKGAGLNEDSPVNTGLSVIIKGSKRRGMPRRTKSGKGDKERMLLVGNGVGREPFSLVLFPTSHPITACHQSVL